MFAFIRGILISSMPSSAILETHGIGYQIYIPTNVFSRLPQIGTELTLHTSYIVRELSHTLYGFLSIQERDLFEVLMSVSGIGPKIALNIIGHLEIHDLHRAINNHDIMTLSKVPGIGKKTAERMIIELRDKLNALLPPTPSELGVTFSVDPKAQTLRDAMSALINLGYNQMTAQKAIKKTLKEAPEEIDLATLITNSLKNV